MPKGAPWSEAEDAAEAGRHSPARSTQAPWQRPPPPPPPRPDQRKQQPWTWKGAGAGKAQPRHCGACGERQAKWQRFCGACGTPKPPAVSRNVMRNQREKQEKTLQGHLAAPPKMPAQLRKLAEKVAPPPPAPPTPIDEEMEQDEPESEDEDEPPMTSEQAAKLAKAAVLMREAGQEEEACRIERELAPLKPPEPEVNLSVAYQQAVRHRAKVKRHLEAVQAEGERARDQLAEVQQRASTALQELQKADLLLEEAHKATKPETKEGQEQKAAMIAVEAIQRVAQSVQLGEDGLERKYAVCADQAQKAGKEAPQKMHFILNELVSALVGALSHPAESSAAPAAPRQQREEAPTEKPSARKVAGAPPRPRAARSSRSRSRSPAKDGEQEEGA